MFNKRNFECGRLAVINLDKLESIIEHREDVMEYTTKYGKDTNKTKWQDKAVLEALHIISDCLIDHELD